MERRDFHKFLSSFIITTTALLLIMGIALADSRIKAMTGYEENETALAFSVNGQKKLQVTVFNESFNMSMEPLGAVFVGYQKAAEVAGKLISPAIRAAGEVYTVIDRTAFPVFSKFAESQK